MEFNLIKHIGLIIPFLLMLQSCQENVEKSKSTTGEKNYFWGDLHNHNSIGYAKGSLERTYQIAQSHLDFFCFTPHSYWPDMPIMPQNAHLKWVEGFKVTKNNWDRVKKLASDYYQPGKFVPFIGYEWHSSSIGDMCIIFPHDTAQLAVFDDVKKLQNFAREYKAVLIPHHPAYKSGWRGQNWSFLDTSVTPVVEIFSEHGNAESDRSPGRYIRHSMGGRYTPNTVQALWQQGVKVGVVASSDDHLGFPGAYGEGLVCVLADTLTRESLIEAIKAKRTYGISADRIEMNFSVDGHYMGETVPARSRHKIAVKVNGKDIVERVEILKNNKVIYRNHPVDNLPDVTRWKKPVLCRIEFGWGPWGDLNMAKICDWQFSVEVKDGTILSATPCFQAGPFDENRRNNLSYTKNKCTVTSYTSRIQAFEEKATNSIILEIQGSPETKLSVLLDLPQKTNIDKTFQELEQSNDIFFTGPFTSESVMIHRLVFHDNYFTKFEFTDESRTESNDWYYARVVQSNGSLAWSSPVWIE